MAARKGDSHADQPTTRSDLSIVGIWKEGRMVDTFTTGYTGELRSEKITRKKIDVTPENVKTLAVRDFDLAQLDLLTELMAGMSSVQLVDLHFRYHDEPIGPEFDVAPVLKTDFLSGHNTIEDIRFKGGERGLHSPAVKSIDLTGLTRLPALTHLSFTDLINLRWLDLSPLSRSRKIQEIGIGSLWSFPTPMLRRVNLTGLNRCRLLSKLYISARCLDELDLSPLDGSESLENLYIGDVNTHVDEGWEEYVGKDSTEVISSPVDSEEKMLELRIPRCEYLKMLTVEEHTRTTRGEHPMTSKFREIDLTNLEQSEQLRHLEIVGQGIFHLDLSPLCSNEALSYIHIRENDNLTEVDISCILPMGYRLKGCHFDKYITHSVFDESSKRSRHVLGPPIKYRASREMEPYYDDAFRNKFVDLLPVPGVLTLVPHPIDIEWY